MVDSVDHLGKSELFIGGAWVAPVKGGKLDVINPASEAIIGSIGAATAEDVDIAVNAARETFKTWGKTTGAERAKLLRAIAAGVRERKSELATTETFDCGKPIDEAEWDMDDVAGCFEYYADQADKLDARTETPVDLPDDRFRSVVRREPLGVVAAITPWNYPLLMATWKVAPALAAGCCVILKPSELASLTCQILCDIAAAAGVPPGALTLLTGLGPDAGAPLAAHPGVAKVAFTGSLATGKRIMAAAAETVKPVSLELGGKSALVVFDDYEDLNQVVEWIMFGIFWTNGQICSATSRLLVHERIYKRLLDTLKHHAEEITISDPLQREPPCRMGPLVSRGQYEKVTAMVAAAVEEGAHVLTGGGRPEHLPKGFFIRPTVLTDVTEGMAIWNQEVFGPVLCVMPFRTEEEAVALADGTPFGLGAAVISGDAERCARLAAAFECGIVWVNCSQPCFCHAPWGGRKMSGFGRELGEFGLENFLNIKQVTTYVSKDQFGWYPSFAKPKM